jgi:hypothetical protein
VKKSKSLLLNKVEVYLYYKPRSNLFGFIDDIDDKKMIFVNIARHNNKKDLLTTIVHELIHIYYNTDDEEFVYAKEEQIINKHLQKEDVVILEHAKKLLNDILKGYEKLTIVLNNENEN